MAIIRKMIADAINVDRFYWRHYSSGTNTKCFCDGIGTECLAQFVNTNRSLLAFESKVACNLQKCFPGYTIKYAITDGRRYQFSIDHKHHIHRPGFLNEFVFLSICP